MKKKKRYPRRFLQTEYDSGFKCCREGLSRTANPNIKSQNEFAWYSWDRGWVAAHNLYSDIEKILS